MGEFNSDNTTVRKNPLKEMEYTHNQQKSFKCSTWMQSQKWQKDLCSFSRETIITVIQVYAATTNAEEAEAEWFYDDL